MWLDVRHLFRLRSHVASLASPQRYVGGETTFHVLLTLSSFHSPQVPVELPQRTPDVAGVTKSGLSHL